MIQTSHFACAKAVQFVRMQSLASISQLLGGLFFGQSADRFGTRWALLTAHAAAMSTLAPVILKAKGLRI